MVQPALRPAEEGDIPALSAFAARSFTETFVEGFAIAYPPEDLADYLERTCSPAAFSGRIADPSVHVWIATGADGTVAAYAVAAPAELPHPELRAEDAEIQRFYLRPDLHGSGFADRALAEVLAVLDPDRRRPVWLSVWSGNLRAQRFYARRGFVHAGEYDYPVGRHVDLDHIYRRPAAAA